MTPYSVPCYAIHCPGPFHYQNLKCQACIVRYFVPTEMSFQMSLYLSLSFSVAFSTIVRSFGMKLYYEFNVESEG